MSSAYVSHLQQIHIVSGAAPKLCCNNLIFIKPGLKLQAVLSTCTADAGIVAKDLQNRWSHGGVFQQDNAPAYHAHNTGELLCHKTLIINLDIYPAESTDLNPVHYHIL